MKKYLLFSILVLSAIMVFSGCYRKYKKENNKFYFSSSSASYEEDTNWQYVGKKESQVTESRYWDADKKRWMYKKKDGTFTEKRSEAISLYSGTGDSDGGGGGGGHH